MRLLASLVLFLWAGVAALAQMPGQDYLACDKFKSAIIANHPVGQGGGCFAEVDGFGNGIAGSDEILSKRKDIPFWRLNLKWRDDHNFQESDFPGIAKTAKKACYLTTKHKIKWYFSGATEHKLNAEKAAKLKKVVLDACPTVTYVNNPLSNGAILPNTINENHNGGKPRSSLCAFSFDGTAAEDADVESVKRAYKGCEYFMMWSPRYNGRWESNDSTPRAKRTGWADGKLIQSLSILHQPKGATSLPKNNLWKSHSENKGNGDPRAEKPVFITPIKAKSISLKQNGREIHSLKYYGPYNDGRSRFYASKWGFEISTAPVELWANGKKHGMVNPGYRDPDFR